LRGVKLRGLLQILLLCVLAASCSKGQSLTDFLEGGTLQSESKINPLFKAETLAAANGDSKLYTLTLKVPLTKDSLGSYDFSEIMENDDLDNSNRSWLKRFFDSVFYNLANIWFRFGQKNKYSYSTAIDFPEIDSNYIKEVRIKKLFFSLEDCDIIDEDCVKRRTSRPPSLNFLRRFFLNVSPLQANELHLLDEGEFKEWGKGDFNRVANKVFNQGYFDNFNDYYYDFLELSGVTENDEHPYTVRHMFNDLNVARLENNKKRQRSEENVRDNGRTFLFRLKKDITKYRKVEIKQHFKQDAFDGVVKDITLLGDNLVVEIYTPEQRADFFRVLSSTVENVDELDIKSFEGCSYINCTTIDVNSINLVPLLEENHQVKFDTFLELRYLEINDFLYNGYVEIEVKLDLPL